MVVSHCVNLVGGPDDMLDTRKGNGIKIAVGHVVGVHVLLQKFWCVKTDVPAILGMRTQSCKVHST